MFSNDDYVQKLYKILLGNNVHWQNREAWVYSKGVHTRYPFQGALYGLPPNVIKECIVGAMESRYGALKKPDSRSAQSAPGTCQVIDGAAHPYRTAALTEHTGYRQNRFVSGSRAYRK